MTVTDQIKILNRKIMQNEAQYDLDRKAAKLSALSSNNLGKYEYLTDEDLGLKLSTVEQAKFEYFPLGMSLSKALKKDEVKSVFKSRIDFNYDSKYAFYIFYKGYDEFKDISLDWTKIRIYWSCNSVKKDYQHASKVLFTFVPNKEFGQLINISPQAFDEHS